jgi:hypothetical protein
MSPPGGGADVPLLERLAGLPAVPVSELLRLLEAIRGAVVARLRASGLPPDDLLLRLQALSPTLGLVTENREWAQHWMADPTAQDAQLVQQCLVRLLLAVRGLAEARARLLTGPGAGEPG